MTTARDRSAFLPGVEERLRFYVYLLIDPRGGDVFYVGKGQRGRCFEHAAAVRAGQAVRDVETAKVRRIADIHALGLEVHVEILRHDLTEHEALLVESAVIDALDSAQLTNIVAGHHASTSGRASVHELNARLGARRLAIAAEHRLLLIRLNELPGGAEDEAALYERTRKWWRIGARWTQPVDPASPTHALAVHRGVVRAAFRISRWIRATEADVGDEPSRHGRFAFEGEFDRELSTLYEFVDVSELLPDKAQNPIYFVNCGGRAL
jgi:hypothetical protein